MSGKYLLELKYDWYNENEKDLYICSSKELINHLCKFLITSEKDHNHSYKFWNLIELNKNDSETIKFLLDQELRKQHNSCKIRLEFYEKVLKLKIEKDKLLYENSFASEMVNINKIDKEIVKLEEIIESLKDSNKEKIQN